MASLVSWQNLPLKKKRSNSILSTLSNFDIRANNAITKQSSPTIDRVSSVSTPTTTQISSASPAPLSWSNRNQQQNVLQTLRNLDIRANNAFSAPSPAQVNRNQNNSLSKIHTANGGKLDDAGKMSFDDFKATMSARNIINRGGSGAPLNATAIKNARAINTANKVFDATNDTATPSTNLLRGLKTYSPIASEDTGWRQYYDKEFRKAKSEQNFGQRLLDNGQAANLAEDRARTKYASRLINAAYDENGNVIDRDLAAEANKLLDYNSQVAAAHTEHSKAISRKIGASSDSDYGGWDPNNPWGSLGKRVYATANTIRNMSLGDAILGANDTQKTNVQDAGKFLIDLLPGMLNAPTTGATNIAEAISGKGTDSETGRHRELTGLERLGRSASGAVDVTGVFFGGSGDFLNAVGKTIFNRGASEAAKQAAKQTTKSTIRGLLKAMVEEGAEEGVQQAFDFFGDGGKLVTADGEFDGEAFKQLLAESGQAAALGAIGGGIFHAGGQAVGAGGRALSNLKNSHRANTNVNENINTAQNVGLNAGVNENLDIVPNPDFNTDGDIVRQATADPSRVQTMQDGSIVKTDINGVATRLSDAELARFANSNTNTTAGLRGGEENIFITPQSPARVENNISSRPQNSTLNPVKDGGVADNSVRKQFAELTERAKNGDPEAIQLLNEYGYQPEEAQEGWQPKTVDEVIDPEEAAQAKENQALLAELEELWGPMEDIEMKSPAKRYSEAESTQRLNDLTNGRLPYDEYAKLQAEMLWEAFKDSNRGTETFLTGMNSYDGDADISRHTVSDNGRLYRQLYQEYGGKPTRAEFYNALNDVLVNGEDSKYYDAFKEFDPNHEVYDYNAGNDDIDTLIAVREYAGSSEYKDMLKEAQMGRQQGGLINRINQAVDGAYTSLVNRGAVDRLEKALTDAMDGGAKGNTKFVRLTNDMLNDINQVRQAQGIEPLTKRQVTAYMNAINNNLTNRVKEGMSPRKVAEIAYESLTNPNAEALPGKFNNTVVVAPYSNEKYAGSVLGKAQDDGTSLKSIEPRATSQVEGLQTTKNDLLGGQQSGSPLAANQEGSVIQSRATNSDSSSTSLADQRPGLSGAPLGVLDESISQGSTDVNTKQNTGRSYENEAEALPEDFDVKHYISEQVAAQKTRSRVPLRERIADATAELKHYLVDDAVAYERYIKDKNERLNIREGVDRVRSSDLIASQWMKDHGLSELGKMSDADLNEFQQYLIAKRAQEVEAQGKKTGRSRAADQALIDRVGNKYAAEEAIVRQYTRDMLEYSAENGLISQKLKRDLLENNPNYVPMNRVFDVLEKKSGFKSKQLGNLGKQSVVQKMMGSERTIENPVETLMTNTMRMINEVERNKTAKMIADSNAFRERVLTEGEEPHAGYDKLSYMIDGETVSYEVPELVAREMKNLNNVMPKAAENALKIFGAPTRWLRSGATQNNPIFAISNLVRDQMQTLVTGKVTANLRGSKDAMVATFSPGKKGKALRDELSRAGIIGNEYRQTYGYKPGEMMAQLQTDAKLGKMAVDKLKHPLNALGDLIGKTEYFTRAQQYFGTKGDAVAKAQAARNNTLNFSRAGATTRILNRIIPFLNAGIQGGRTTVNQLVKRPIHTTLAVATFAGVASLARSAAEAQDKELWDRIDDSEKQQNIILFTPNARYNSKTNRAEGIIKIPVAQMIYPVMDGVNNLNGTAEDVGTLASDLLTAVTGLESPNAEEGFLPVINQLTPTAAKPFVEWAMNKSTYTGNELVSDYDSNENPEDKGAKYTTGAARTISKLTGVDAPVVDNFIQNWGGGLAKDLAKTLTDNPDNAKDGGGLGAMFGNGFDRRFLSGAVESQYSIAEGLAKDYKNRVKASESFKNLPSAEQQSVLNAIDNDMKNIAGVAAKAEQGRADEKTKLSARQTEIVKNGFNPESYIKAIADKDKTYAGNGGGDVTTLSGDLSDYGAAKRRNSIKISDSLGQEYRDVLAKYNSMSEKNWDKYLNGSSAESAAAEYKLALAKYENDLADDKLNAVQKIKRQKELAKLDASKGYTKDIRDIYSLAGTKGDIQQLLNSISDQKERANVVGILNGLNKTLLDAGVISVSTYNTRGRNINNLTATKSSKKKSTKSTSSTTKANNGISAAEAGAISKMVRSLSSSDTSGGYKVAKQSAPSTNRQMKITYSKGNSYNLSTYTPKKASISSSKGSNTKGRKS